MASGDTVHYKANHVLDPATGSMQIFLPIEILTFPGWNSDSLTAESATSGGGRGIALDADGYILSSHYKTLTRLITCRPVKVLQCVGCEGTLSEAAADDNGNAFIVKAF
ncbi:MAG: hypothetical protein CM15mP53_06120 [Ectothiorhodospiraceae bacterium]|nr:MAG: hypothetical protein CM15mP53_06120 [Ectothiorhodospiraceae bacterium]